MSHDIETLFFQIMNIPQPFMKMLEIIANLSGNIRKKTLSYLEKQRNLEISCQSYWSYSQDKGIQVLVIVWKKNSFNQLVMPIVKNKIIEAKAMTGRMVSHVPILSAHLICPSYGHILYVPILWAHFMGTFYGHIQKKQVRKNQKDFNRQELASMERGMHILRSQESKKSI